MVKYQRDKPRGWSPSGIPAKMKGRVQKMKRILVWVLAIIMLLGQAAFAEGTVDIDWSVRYRYAELEDQLKQMNAAYGDITTLYPIGHTWMERSLWCIEITNKAIPEAEKTGVAVFGNIHGGERESASAAMYFAWWLTENSASERVAAILDNYTVYVIPVINPDGYEQSFVYNTRQNMRPVDANGNNIAFSDPYTDIDGDGYIATLYRGKADEQPNRRSGSFGMESPDWDRNGILGDDPRNSGIDMNRTFDYQWKRYDIDTVNTEAGVIGANSYTSGGPSAASEPEIQAVQNFLLNKRIDALATLHTGIQAVLYPWCYRPYDPAIDSDDIVYMKGVAEKMAAAYQETTGRGCYTMCSYDDYPTSAELIDYSYGRLNIQSYTIEVYNGGKSRSGDISECKWENELPAEKWAFYTQEQLAAMGLDLARLTDGKGVPLAEDEGLWFYTSSTAQMVDKAPDGQELLCEGTRDALLVMVDSVPHGAGYTKPEYLNW